MKTPTVRKVGRANHGWIFPKRVDGALILLATEVKDRWLCLSTAVQNAERLGRLCPPTMLPVLGRKRALALQAIDGCLEACDDFGPIIALSGVF